MTLLFHIRTVQALLHAGRLSWRLARDRRTPWGPKLLLGGMLLLIASPINWIPSLIPVLGQLEDLALVALAFNIFLKRVPADLRAEHEAALRYAQPRGRRERLPRAA